MVWQLLIPLHRWWDAHIYVTMQFERDIWDFCRHKLVQYLCMRWFGSDYHHRTFDTVVDRIYLSTLHLKDDVMCTSCALLCFVYSFIYMGQILNPLCIKIFLENIKLYLQFISFLHTGTTQVAEIFPHVRQELTYSTWSISWALMSWWHKEPGHQQPWYWPS